MSPSNLAMPVDVALVLNNPFQSAICRETLIRCVDGMQSGEDVLKKSVDRAC